MTLGIIGYGNMGESFARSLREHAEVLVYDISEEKRSEALSEGFGVASDLDFLLRGSQWLLLAVKPKDVESVMKRLSGRLEGKMLISVVAGLSLERLKELSGAEKLIRLMPNINALVGKATIAFACAEISEEEKEEFIRLFSHCGNLYELEESLFDAFTALAGSGPAFVFSFVHALALAGVMEGFSYEKAKSMAIDMVLGSCELLKRLGGNPEEWLTKVASPGGTTIEGIKVLEERGFKGIIMECIRRTSEKAKRL
ncbi:MAG: pyrroline-5-carboxylate reductase [Aquificaceae bacterium]|jgi:pyrroline-5-carboxylate reductase|uniref:pyrroline-5-carboxylate reductase n=1 Tax=Hydrogenobacter sp. Uz 6-8 TaxID=3384828 RepID=UPI000F25C958|nr:MAG: pyrroline-5-carboxylate reductase [Aquificota bacterium]